MLADFFSGYFLIAFIIILFCDDEGFPAMAKGFFWPVFVTVHACRLLGELICGKE